MGNGATTIVNFNTKKIDTHNAVTTGASWKFTAPFAGVYEFSGMISYASGGGWGVGEEVDAILFKNNGLHVYVNVQYMQVAHSTFVSQAFASAQIQLNAGEFVDLRGFQNSGGSLNLVNSAGVNWISIKQVK
jgi:hypothetical protein